MENKEIIQKIQELERRINLLEFQKTLIVNQDNVGSILLEYNVSEDEYKIIMDIMDKYRERIDRGEEVHNIEFEKDIIDAFGGDMAAMERNIEYHFCEYIAKAFMDDNRWEEVFPALYGNMAKYKYLEE